MKANQGRVVEIFKLGASFLKVELNILENTHYLYTLTNRLMLPCVCSSVIGSQMTSSSETQGQFNSRVDKKFLVKVYCNHELLSTRLLNCPWVSEDEMTSKCGKNKDGECVTDVFTTFWRPLWSINEQTHGNKESICFIQWSEKKIDRYTYLPRTAWLFEDLC